MISRVTDEPGGRPCSECSIRWLTVCAALGDNDLRELEHLSRHMHFSAGETVFAEEEMTTSFYNLQSGVMRLYKLLRDGRRQIIGFALPGDFLGLAASSRHSVSADAIGPVELCRFSSLHLRASANTSRSCCGGSMNWRFENLARLRIILSCWDGVPRKRRLRPS
jgi:CRP-like cAMP-binding protein